MNKIIFLDVDGCLNKHGFNQISQSSSFDKECVDNFNYLLEKTNPKIVLSSAWRYMIGTHVTLKGFEYLLRTHGIDAHDRLIDRTVADEVLPERSEQINHWIKSNKSKVNSFVILDDLIIEWGDLSRFLIQTERNTGLTKELADKAIEILNGKREK